MVSIILGVKLHYELPIKITMNPVRHTYSSVFKLLLLVLILLQLKASAQNKPTYLIGKESYRVIAIKEDTNQVESTSNVVQFAKSTTIYLPNAFTPDQDGANDRFGAIGLNAESYDLKVFNRWGELIFTSTHINDKWDGTYKGKLVPEGVYVYTMYAKEAATGKAISKTGTVTLIL